MSRSMGQCGRGMTLLEVVLAIAALGLIAAGATTTVGYLYGSQIREERRLAATELASRLILIYLDNPNDLPDSSEQIAYGRDSFRYDLSVMPVRVRPHDAVRRALAERRSSSPIPIDRFEQVRVRVWLGENSGGSVNFSTAVPNAVLVRLYDPNYFNRNPDSGAKLFEDEQRRNEMFQQILGGTP